MILRNFISHSTKKLPWRQFLSRNLFFFVTILRSVVTTKKRKNSTEATLDTKDLSEKYTLQTGYSKNLHDVPSHLRYSPPDKVDVLNYKTETFFIL